MADLEPFDLLKATVDPVRLAVLGDAAQGTMSIDTVAERLDVPRKQVAEAVGYLRTVGLLDDRGDLVVEALRDVARSIPADPEPDASAIDGPFTTAEAEVLARFFEGGRLTRIPTNRRKRLLVLDKIAQEFEPGRRYAERDVSFTIQLIYPDYAAIRRYLIDEGFMDRADGAYWRTGGRFEMPLDDEPFDDGAVVLATRRPGLELRTYDGSMVEALVEAANHPSINRYMGDMFPHPYTVADAEGWLELAARQPVDSQFGIFEDGRLVGGCGGFLFKGENTGVAEIGWWLTPDRQGQGITTDAVIALVDYLFAELGLMRLWAPVMAPNTASARVAEKAGLSDEGLAPSAYLKGGVRYDQRHFGITRSQWMANRSR